MELEILRAKLPEYLERVTVKERSGLYHCPLCGSGTHRGAKSDGAFSVYGDGTRWHCFACGDSGDIFTLIGRLEHLDAFPDQLRFAAELFGIPLNSVRVPKDAPAKSEIAAFSMRPEVLPQPDPEPDLPQDAPPEPAFHDYIAACAVHANDTDYWTKERGFSPEIVSRFLLGFDAEKQAVVIPYDREGSYYLTRSIRGKDFRKPKTQLAGEEPLYNKNALYQSEHVCFVCESPIDAISVMAAGAYQAVALGGTGARKLLTQIAKRKPAAPLILCLDCDEAGRKAEAQLAAELEKLQIPFRSAVFDPEAYPEHQRKDANDFFRGNRAAFAQQLMQNAEAAERIAAAEQHAARSDHEQNSGYSRLAGFLDRIHGSHASEAVATGFAALDEQLDGGLYAGLYILGAVSSLGKTTFLLQMADQIAEAGRDVMYISLEMSAHELMAKSISRQTFLQSGEDMRAAKTVRGITTHSRYAQYRQAELQLIDKAVLAYQKYSSHLYYYEGIGDIGVAQIREYAEAHINLTGRKPVIMIDYLQILAPYDLRASDKQNTDKAVLELKRMSRDLDIPVFAISSLNRESYGAGEIEMQAFKESGAIEYGSDVLIGLQVQGTGSTKAGQENMKIITESKTHHIRNVELKILKNRSGQTGGKIGLRYYALFNCFTPDESYVQRRISDKIGNEGDFTPAGL